MSQRGGIARFFGLAAGLLSILAAVPADLQFAPWFTSRGVKVEIARRKGELPWLRASADLAVSAEKVAAILTDFTRYRETFAPGLKKADVLKSSPGFARLHLVWPYPFPLRNRDAVVAYRMEPGAAGRWVLSWRGDARPRDPAEGVRIDHVAGETSVEPLDTARCRVTYTYLGDLGGRFPASVEDKAWREEPVQYLRALRRTLKLPDVAD